MNNHFVKDYYRCTCFKLNKAKEHFVLVTASPKVWWFSCSSDKPSRELAPRPSSYQRCADAWATSRSFSLVLTSCVA